MLDEFEDLYSEEKASLFPNLSKHNNFTEHKEVLDGFFERLDKKTMEIKNSHTYKAFKQRLNGETH